jgi:hypothetical protein
MFVIALALVASACGDDAETTTTAASSGGDTATTAAGAGASGAEAAAAKSDAVVEAAPDGWTVEVTNTLAASEPIEQQVLFAPCLEGGSFDFGTLDADSVAAINTSVAAPLSPDAPAASNASVETRVFVSESAAAGAYSVLESILGTTIGRECVAASSFDLIKDQLPEGASTEYRVEEFLLATGDYGTSLIWLIKTDSEELSVFIDMVAYRDGDCTIFTIFTGFGEPFPTAVAVQLMDAAIAAG